MYRCESWTIKKAELWRIDAFKLWFKRKSNQSIVKKINPEYSLEGLALRLQYTDQALWSIVTKSRLIGKDPDAGKDRGQEEKGTTEDEMVGWHHRFDGHEFEHTLGDSEGRGSLACCSPWGCRESQTTERLNNSNGIWSRAPYLLIFYVCVFFDEKSLQVFFP